MRKQRIKISEVALAVAAAIILLCLQSWSTPQYSRGAKAGISELYKLSSDTTVTAYKRFIDSLRNLNLSPDSLRKMGLSDTILASIDSARRADSIASIKVYSAKELRRMRRDSIKEEREKAIRNTPRVLQSYIFADSIVNTRIFAWQHNSYVNRQELVKIDTSFNYHFHDIPFQRDDINGEYLGVNGSAAQPFNYFKREKEDIFPFFSPYMTYTYMPNTLPFYNTKTPYTELAYWGTLLSNKQKGEDNIKFLHTQNFTPSFNFSILYKRNGGGGLLQNEKTDFRTLGITGNYLGKRYIAQGGYLYSRLKRTENGGIEDITMFRDTTIDVRTIPVYLQNASSVIKRNTFFITHSYGIPIRWKIPKDSLGNAIKDTMKTSQGTVTYFGHYGEFTTYSRVYEDYIQNSLADSAARSLYRDQFFINPTNTFDSARVMKLENRFFIKLQPWNSNSIISNLDGGIGHQLLSNYGFQPDFFVTGNKNKKYNNLFAYFGASGQYRKYVQWNALAQIDFAGYYKGGFSVDAAAKFSSWAIEDGIHLTAKFHSSLRRPSYFYNNYYSNHYIWDNDFAKSSQTRIEAALNIPRWNLEATFGYSLLSNNIYIDSLGMAQQNSTAMSVMSASLSKKIRLGVLNLDNRLLFQLSSNQEVIPLPKLALNLRYYLQFYVVKNVLNMQVGADFTYNTLYYAPAFSPALGMFHTQNRMEIGNCPYIDAFVNMQWKRASIFVKVENVTQGWTKNGYFSTYRYIRPQRALKFGIWWPFYIK